MALTQTDLENLQSAMASGELEVEYDGRRVRFASAADIEQRIRYVQGVLSVGAGGTSRPTGAFRFDFNTQRGD
jgi:hypothetical protein